MVTITQPWYVCVSANYGKEGTGGIAWIHSLYFSTDSKMIKQNNLTPYSGVPENLK